MGTSQMDWSYWVWIWTTLKQSALVIATFLGTVSVSNPQAYNDLIANLELPAGAIVVLGLIINYAKFNGLMPRILEGEARKT